MPPLFFAFMKYNKMGMISGYKVLWSRRNENKQSELFQMD